MTNDPQPDPRNPEPTAHRPPRSSRGRYLLFVKDYKQGRLDDSEERREKLLPEIEETEVAKRLSVLEMFGLRRGKRREYLREYFNWLWPHRYSVGMLFLLALI